MERQLSELERLDLAARAQVTEHTLGYLRLGSLPLSAFSIWLGFVSEASFAETLAVRILALIVTVNTALLWVRWKYAFHLWAVVQFLIAVGFAFGLAHWSSSPLGLIAKSAAALSFLLFGYHFWKMAAPFALSHREGWEKEHSQVSQWLHVMTRVNKPKDVFERSTGNFWRGYFTCRIFDSGDYWVMAKFKKGNLNRLVEYRVRPRTSNDLAELWLAEF